MTEFVRRALTLSLFLVLFASVSRLCVQAQTERQPTEQQVRAHLLDKMQASLRLRSRGFTGWQSAHTNRKGNTLYAYVQGGKVVGFAIGRPNMVNALKRFAPNGTSRNETVSSSAVLRATRARPGTTAETPVNTGGGAKEQPNDGDGPTEDECAAKYVECMFDTSALDLLRGLAMIKNVFTLDIDALVGNYEDREEKMKKCVGEACAKILAL